MTNNTNDDGLFKEYMKGVKPLSQDQHRFISPSKTFKKITHPQAIQPSVTYEYIYDPLLTNQDNWLTGDEIAHFRRDGISTSTLKLLKAGKINWQARLDLHHYTTGHAVAAIDDFLAETSSKQIRCVLIIHGKGSRTPDQKPILKNILITHLRDNLNVLAYHSAKPNDGGTGAMYVYLRSQKI